MIRQGIPRNTWIMVGVFFLLLLVFFALQRTGGGAPAEQVDFPTPEIVPPLFDFDASTVTRIRIANLDGQAVEFAREGEVWLLKQPAAPAEETDITRIEGLIAAFAGLRPVAGFTIDAPLSAIGLQFPPYSLTLTLPGGETHVLAIGDAAVTGTGYYVSLDGGPVQLATKSVLDQFIGLLDSPPLLPTPIPEPTEPITGTLELTPTGEAP